MKRTSESGKEKEAGDSPEEAKEEKTSTELKSPPSRSPPDLGKFLHTFTILMGCWILFTILSQRMYCGGYLNVSCITL